MNDSLKNDINGKVLMELNWNMQMITFMIPGA